MSVPMIDISKIRDPAEQIKIAEQVTAASKERGFLLIKGHSIPQDDIEDLFQLGKEFFTLPDGEKDPYKITPQGTGYMGSFRDSHADMKDSMWFGGAVTDNVTALPPFWRSHVEKVETFKGKCRDLILQLLECFAIGLQLPDQEFFATAHKASETSSNTLRMIRYPSTSDISVSETQRSGRDTGVKGGRMAPHTDSGSVTLLFQKQPGLEVMSPKGNTWVPAPCHEDCILVNIGDALSFWSGGQLKATMHRVTFDTVPSNQERQTMAYFGYANPNTVLDPILPRPEAEKYYSNGVELTPGMTVEELRKTILGNIYRTPATQKPVLAS